MDVLAVFVVGLIITIILFVVFREIVCWYWKINETVELLKDIRNLLQNSQNNGGAILQSIPNIASNSLVENSNNKDNESENSGLDNAVGYSYMTATEWICICGTHNALNKNQKKQYCSNCLKNRDYVLKEFDKNKVKAI